MSVAAAVFSGAVACKPKGAAAGAGGFPPTQVVMIEARKRPVSETLSLVGTLTADEMVEIKSEIDGLVKDVHFDEGRPVETGQLLLQIDDSKLVASAAEAEANFKLSQANFDRMRQLLKDKLVSQQEFDQAAAVFDVNRAGLDLKRQLLKDTRITAPFSGITGARNVSPGQVIAKNATLTWIVQSNPVKVEVNVPERFLAQLQLGQDIEIGVASLPGRKFRGKVYFIAPQLDPATRTALVKARIENPKLELRPGMFANLDLTLQIRDQAVVIPEAALMWSGERASIYVVDGEMTAQIRPVKPGVRLTAEVEITSGLKAGEKVIVEGFQKTRPGGKVAPAPAAASEPYLGLGKPAKTPVE
jgi:membrane fusion protein (multidrug efflux system)